MKKIALFSLLVLALVQCTPDPNERTLESRLHGSWTGVKIDNHLTAQGLWDTLHPHTTSYLTMTFDTLSGSFVVDSAGIVLDSASFSIGSDSSITVVGATNASRWSIDKNMISAFGQPLLQELESNFTGNQKSQILYVSENELQLYFEKLLPVNYQGFQATMKLRHTEYWFK